MKGQFCGVISILLCLGCSERSQGTADHHVDSSHARGVQVGTQGYVSFDAGERYQDSFVEHEFEFTNNSGVAVNVIDKQLSCSCSKLNLSSNSIQPGEKLVVDVSLRVRAEEGEFRESIILKTDSSTVPSIVFEVRGQVKPGLDYPDEFNLGELVAGQQFSSEMVVWRNGKASANSILLKDVESSVAGVDFSIETMSDEEAHQARRHQGWRIRAVGTLKVPQVLNGIARMRTTLPDLSMIDIPLKGEVVPPVYSKPGTLVWATLAADSIVESEVLSIRSRVNEQFHILNIETDRPEIEAKLIGDGTTALELGDVEVTLSSLALKAVPGVHKGHVLIQTDSEFEPLIAVPVIWHLSKQLPQ